MTHLEKLQAQLRESQMRLREVRTENAELKIQYRRWLVISAAVSVASLILAFFVLLTEGTALPTMPSGDRERPRTSLTLPSPQGSEQPATQQSQPVKQAPAESIEQDPLDLPDWDGEFSSSTDPWPEEEKLTTDATPSPPKPTPPSTQPKQSFQLPGSSSEKNNKMVVHHQVQKNDTLWKIIERYNGTPTPTVIDKVMRDNGLSSSRIQPGTTLILILDKK